MLKPFGDLTSALEPREYTSKCHIWFSSQRYSSRTVDNNLALSPNSMFSKLTNGNKLYPTFPLLFQLNYVHETYSVKGRQHLDTH